jgi:hypothetical protein
MAGLVPAIHVLSRCDAVEDVDAIRTRACPSSAILSGESRVNPTFADKRGHDGAATAWRRPSAPTLQLTEIVFQHDYTPDKVGADTIHHDPQYSSVLWIPVMEKSE